MQRIEAHLPGLAMPLHSAPPVRDEIRRSPAVPI